MKLGKLSHQSECKRGRRRRQSQNSDEDHPWALGGLGLRVVLVTTLGGLCFYLE